MVTFDVETDRELTLSDGTSVPFLAVLYGDLVGVQILDANGDPIKPNHRPRRVLFGDPQSVHILRFVSAPNWVYNDMLDRQTRHERAPGDRSQSVGIVADTAFRLNDDGTRGDALSPEMYLEE